MISDTIKYSNSKVSKIGLGLANISSLNQTNLKDIIFTIEKGIESGINHFDTAWSYGNGASEIVLGRILRKHSEKNLFFSTKIPLKRPLIPKMNYYGAYSSDHIISFTEKSLKNLGVENIPLLYFLCLGKSLAFY